MNRTAAIQAVEVPAGAVRLKADLRVPAGAKGLVIFSHGSGSSRFSSRNRQVAEFLGERGFATLLLDLLTAQEETIDERTAEFRFDIARLGPRVSAAADWAATRGDVRRLPIGCFGASTGAAAALIAAADRPATIAAVVSRGGRPDLAGEVLARVEAATLLIVGGHDEPVIDLNRAAMRLMHAHVELEIVPGATHLFEEPGTLDQVEDLAASWFTRYLRATAADRRRRHSIECPVCQAHGPLLHHDIRGSLVYFCQRCQHEWQIDPAEEPLEVDLTVTPGPLRGQT